MYAVDIPERLEVIELLLKHQANPHVATKQGNTALRMAVDRENIDAWHANEVVAQNWSSRALGLEFRIDAARTGERAERAEPHNTRLARAAFILNLASWIPAKRSLH